MESMSTDVSKEEREMSTTGREHPRKWGAKILEGGEELDRGMEQEHGEYNENKTAKRKREDISPGIMKVRKIFEKGTVNEEIEKANGTVQRNENYGQKPTITNDQKLPQNKVKVRDAVKEFESKGEQKMKKEKMSRVQAAITKMNLEEI